MRTLSLSQGNLHSVQFASILLATVWVTASLFIQPVFAQGTTPTDDEVNRIAKQLYCPVCESTPLDVCPTEACRQWRDVIRTMLSEGRSEAEIKQHFVEQYGVRVLNEPPNRLVSYLVPGIAILLGAFILLRGFQTWKKVAVKEPIPVQEANNDIRVTEVQPEQDQYIARMEEELRKRNESSSH
ncbi:MAG TPA: cytochrome c-type biogenesis protein CcmH [Anaerolineales bacterium]|nr:cytochrome c-type biogenesis protein CcmH [Anaerolineales bacterium]